MFSNYRSILSNYKFFSNKQLYKPTFTNINMHLYDKYPQKNNLLDSLTSNHKIYIRNLFNEIHNKINQIDKYVNDIKDFINNYENTKSTLNIDYFVSISYIKHKFFEDVDINKWNQIMNYKSNFLRISNIWCNPFVFKNLFFVRHTDELLIDYDLRLLEYLYRRLSS